MAGLRRSAGKGAAHGFNEHKARHLIRIPMLVYPVDQATPRPSNQYIGRFLARSRQHGYKVMDRVASRHPTAGRWIAATVAGTVIRTRPRQPSEDWRTVSQSD